MIRRLGFVLAIVALVSGAGLLLRAEPPQDVGTWASIGNAPENRIGAAAVALADGRTLIAGGLANGTPTDAVVVFDPADSSFATAGQLLEPRAGHTATLLEDGRVLIAGGKVNDILTGDLEIFDPSDGSSTLVATLAMLRSGHAAARFGDGKVLIAGGTGTDGVLQTAEIYDPATGAVSLTGSALNIARTGASATALIDGRVLIAGGNNGNPDGDLASAEIYNPSTDSFQATDTNLDAPRSNHTAVLLPNNNSVLIAGGTSDGTPLATADLFLPAQFPDPYSYGMGRFALTGEMAAPR
ncbi:MAG: kelch repeat-containing protein, partial [Vicinamibacterales bacterium]